MRNKIPNTPFATRLSGSEKETKLRIHSIFQWKKECPPVWLMILLIIAILGPGLMFGINTKSSIEDLAVVDESADSVFAAVLGKPWIRKTFIFWPQRKFSNPVLFLNAAGQEITVELELDPTARDKNYYAVTQIRVMEQERTLQVIDPSELTTAYSIDGLYFLRGYDVGKPDVRDFNFDGYEDLALLAESTISQNPSYLFFLWNKEKRGLEASFVMTALPELDDQQKQVTEKLTNGRCRYYDWQEGWLRENPAPRQTMELLAQLGESFEQFDDLQFKNINVPDASGQCMYNVENGISYFFFGTQGLPGLAELPQEYTRQLKCAGIVSTVVDLFPQITEGMPLNWFCDTFEISDYSYGYEDSVDQGWLNILLDDRFTAWIHTDNPVMEVHDPTAVVVDPDDVLLFVDVTIEKENYLICEEYWNEIMMAEIMG